MDSQGHDIQSPGAGRTVEGLAGRRILLGITGSIAAYKAAVLCRLLKCAGAEVRVVMTPLAKQFITPLTMATLSKNPILVEFFDPENGAWNSHVSLGEWADCYLIAPATANTLAKMACGIADNLQTFFDGNLWIITRRKKTNTESNIRLLDVPRKIIEKYKGMAKDNKVFPMPSNTTCNKKLKAIADLCGIKTHLTYHVARHSAATTILLSNGVPIETVSRLLGHTNIKTTQIYAKITAQKISQDLELLSDKLGDMEKSICSAI